MKDTAIQLNGTNEVYLLHYPQSATEFQMPLYDKIIAQLLEEIEARDQEITMLRVVDEKQRQDNENLKSTMVAAAEEIMRCWPDHCDEEGYGPANLMHRLEKGIAANYLGYKMGAFTNMQAKLSHQEEIIVAADNALKEYNKFVNGIGSVREVTQALEKYQTLKANQKESNL